MKTLKIYHSKDLDGLCSGAILDMKFPEGELYGYDYGEPIQPLLELAKQHEQVIMADVSLSMADMEKLGQVAPFTWIDHHKSAIDDYNQRVEEILDHGGNAMFLNPFLEVGKSACELCWEHFYPKKPIPLTVFLLGKYDTWRQENEKRRDDQRHFWSWRDTLAFQMGMRLPNNYSILSIQGHIKNSGLHAVMGKGNTILAYQKQQYEQAAKSSFEAIIGDLRCICLNIGGANSTAFDSVWDEDKYDAMCTFFYTGSQWRYTLFTTHEAINVSKIAKEFGGGGHAKAAGFKLDRLIIVPTEL